MSDKITMSSVLYKPLSIPEVCRRNIYVERALQERNAAAAALKNLEVLVKCLEFEIDALTSYDPVGMAILNRAMKTLDEMRQLTVYSEAKMMLADAT